MNDLILEEGYIITFSNGDYQGHHLIVNAFLNIFNTNIK